MKRFLVIAAAALLLASCTDPEGATKAAENLGLTNVRPTGYSLFGCGKGDVYSTAFTARNPQGLKVSDVVCRGFLKGSTVRFD